MQKQSKYVLTFDTQVKTAPLWEAIKMFVTHTLGLNDKVREGFQRIEETNTP